MHFRDYIQGDEPTVVRVVAEVLRTFDLHANRGPLDDDLQDIDKNYIIPGGMFKVLEDNNTVVGTFGIYVISAHTCELRKMFLLPEYQRRGFGKIMLENAISWANSPAVSG